MLLESSLFAQLIRIILLCSIYVPLLSRLSPFVELTENAENENHHQEVSKKYGSERQRVPLELSFIQVLNEL